MLNAKTIPRLLSKPPTFKNAFFSRTKTELLRTFQIYTGHPVLSNQISGVSLKIYQLGMLKRRLATKPACG